MSPRLRGYEEDTHDQEEMGRQRGYETAGGGKDGHGGGRDGCGEGKNGWRRSRR